MQNTTTRRTRDDFRLMARARRLETERATEAAAFQAAGRCTCGLPVAPVCLYHRSGGRRDLACSFDGQCLTACGCCRAEQSAKARSAFEGL